MKYCYGRNSSNFGVDSTQNGHIIIYYNILHINYFHRHLLGRVSVVGLGRGICAVLSFSGYSRNHFRFTV